MGNHRAIGQNIRYSGLNCALGPSKSIRYSGIRYNGVHVHIFYCNSAGLSNVFRYNWVFVIAGFAIAGCRCIKTSNNQRLGSAGEDDASCYWVNKDVKELY